MSTTAFTLITPGPEHAEALARMHVASWRETYGDALADHHYGEDAIAARAEQYARTLSAGDAATSRIRAGLDPAGEIVGLVWAGAPSRTDRVPAARAEELQVLYTMASMHGSGLGRALVAEVLADRPAQLWVWDRNPRAIRFYSKLGFTADGVADAEPDWDGLVDLRMVR